MGHLAKEANEKWNSAFLLWCSSSSFFGIVAQLAEAHGSEP